MAEDTPAKQAYKAWIAAALTAAEFPSETKARALIGVRMRTFVKAHGHLWNAEGEDDQRRRWESDKDPRGQRVNGDWLANNVRGWSNGKVPQPEALRAALTHVITELVPEPPAAVAEIGSWLNFADVLDALVTGTHDSRGRSSAAAKLAGKVKRTNAARDLLRASGRADHIDPLLALGLGSWIVDNALPPYVERDADRLLRHYIAEPAKRIAVVVGPPKSGKTRSIYHVLRAAAPDALCWWHNPSRHGDSLGALADRIDTLTDRTDRPDVLILEDAGFNDVGPNGLTSTRLHRLSSRVNTLIVVLHEADLASWRHHATGGQSASQLDGFSDSMSIGASPELVQLLDAHAVVYEATLGNAEIALAETVYRDWLDERQGPGEHTDYLQRNLNRLPETLAAVHKLESKARQGLAEGGMRAALIEAAIDATILGKSGVDGDLLERLTILHYKQIAPHARWRTQQFDTAFDWATTGFSAGSPHAIIVRGNSLAGDAYRLLDALAPRLVLPDRDLRHLAAPDLHLTATASNAIAWFLHRAAKSDEALRWWISAADCGNIDALMQLGALAYDTGRAVNGAKAEHWWALAATAGSGEAMNNLGVLAYESGELVGDRDAEQWWLLAADAGSGFAMYGLGFLAEDTVRPVGGRDHLEWWVMAADAGNTDPAYALGSIAYDTGQTVGGRNYVQWWLLAADAGHPRAMRDLGLHARNTGQTVGGRDHVQWWLRAAFGGDTTALYNLGLHAGDSGRSVGGRDQVQWWLLAADAGYADAMFNLGCNASDSGRPVGGRDHLEWWVMAADAGDTRAMFNLGHTGQSVGGRDQEQWWLLAADAGSTRAMHSLGFLADAGGRPVGGRDQVQWWLLAADAGDAGAMYSLGILAEGSAEVVCGRDAEQWWLLAAGAGNWHAMYNLGELARETGQLVGDRDAEQWWLLAADTGNTAAMLDLGLHARAAGRPVGGRDHVQWWVLAAGAGSADAMYNLGELARETGELVGGRRRMQWRALADSISAPEAVFKERLRTWPTGYLVHRRDQVQWWILAAKAGNTIAMHQLDHSCCPRGEVG